MKGTVTIFNVLKQLGFIRGEDTKEYFVHASEINLPTPSEEPPFNFLLPGWNVEFTPAPGKQGPVATKVAPLNPIGYTRRPIQKWARAGTVDLQIRDGIYLGGQNVAPHVHADGRFYAWSVGYGEIRGFSLALPTAEQNRAWVLLDPEKSPRKPTEKYEAKPGSYIVRVDRDGVVQVWRVGFRREFKWRAGEETQWLVLEHRFWHNYGNVCAASRETLEAATPTTGKARDNNGFIPGIMRAIDAMKSAAA